MGEKHMNLKTIRFLSNNMSQTELAKKVGLQQCIISWIESGRFNPTEAERERIDAALKFPVDWDETLRKIGG
jgi:transcriptional regulator with XRE-family HTH domain